MAKEQVDTIIAKPRPSTAIPWLVILCLIAGIVLVHMLFLRSPEKLLGDPLPKNEYLQYMTPPAAPKHPVMQQTTAPAAKTLPPGKPATTSAVPATTPTAPATTPTEPATPPPAVLAEPPQPVAPAHPISKKADKTSTTSATPNSGNNAPD